MIDFFKKSFYINRKNRKDRRENFENQLNNLNLFDWVERYEAVEKEDVAESTVATRSEIASGTSHRNVIKIAKENKFENVLIFEDDAIFLENFQEVVQKSIEQSKGIDWEIFYLSCRLFDNPINFISENLIKIKSCYCCHAYCVNQKAYDKYLEYDPPSVGAADVYLLNRFNCIGSYPLCVSVYPSNSDLINGFACYDDIFRESYKIKRTTG